MEREQKIDYRSPLYLQLREVMRSKIESGEYPPGTCIPSENVLAETYGIHRLSVRSAISALIYEGLLKSVQGRGVFVLADKIERDLDTLGGFKQTMLERNKVPSTRTLTKALRPAEQYYASLLKIKPEDMLYYIRRICSCDGVPVSLEEVYIPEQVVPNLCDIDLRVFSIYDVYHFSNIRLLRAAQTLDLTTLEPADAKLLNIEPEVAVMKFQGISYDDTGRAVEYARTYTRGDICTFSVHFRR